MLNSVALDFMAAPATLANPLAALSGITDAIKDTAAQAGAAMIGPATAIMGAAIAIRIVRAWLESAFDGDALTLINEAILNLVLGTILMMGLSNYDAICSFVWGLGMDAMKLFGGGQSGADIMDTIWGGSIKAMADLTDLLVMPGKGPDGCTGSGLSWLACKSGAVLVETQTNLVVAIFVGIGLIMLLIFLGIMLFQVMRGIFQIAVALAWMPLTMGFYPLIDSWLRNVIGLIASGIANMAMIAFLVKAMSGVVTAIVHEATTSTIIALPAVGGLAAGAVNKITGVLIACLGIMVIAFLSSAAMSYGTSIFGSPSGWGSIKGGKPSGGGKSAAKAADKATEKAGAAGAAATKAGASVADASGAAVAAAGVATGGAATAASAVGSAANPGAMSKLASAYSGAQAGMQAGASAAGGGRFSQALGAIGGAASGAIAGSRVAGSGKAALAGRLAGKGAGAAVAAGGVSGAIGSASRMAGRAASVGMVAAGRAAMGGARVAGVAGKGIASGGRGGLGAAGSALKFYARNVNHG